MFNLPIALRAVALLAVGQTANLSGLRLLAMATPWQRRPCVRVPSQVAAVSRAGVSSRKDPCELLPVWRCRFYVFLLNVRLVSPTCDVLAMCRSCVVLCGVSLFQTFVP